MAEAGRPRVFTIPLTQPFADAFAEELLRRHGTSPEALSAGMILVPNSRAGQAIRDAFVRRAENGLLLPRLVPVGDADLEERTGVALEMLDDDPVPPAIDPLRRQMRLARMVQKERGGDAGEALRLAADLARMLDQLTVEEVAPNRLREIGEEAELSRHWQHSLDQLRLIIEAWPAASAAGGWIDLAERRNRLLDRVAGLWRRRPPAGFVIAAGISTTAPAIARLLRMVARLPRGEVVLAGLDLEMTDEDWAALGAEGPDAAGVEAHPQFHLFRLLALMGVARGEVRTWPGTARRGPEASRGALLSQAFALPDATRAWASLPRHKTRLSGVSALELATPAEEAQAIAIAMRGALEEPGRTVALVTPDRQLAVRVSAALARYGIVADDSAGQPLGATPPATLMLALAEAAAEQFSPAPLLRLLKHPLVRAGEARLAWLDGARTLDLALRGPRPSPGLDGVSAFLGTGEERTAALRARALAWWGDAVALLRPLEALGHGSAGRHLPGAAATVRAVAETLAGEALWAGPAGRALASLWSLVESEEAGPELNDVAVLPAVLAQLFGQQVIRPGFGGHPRVFIWGLLEARLQRADLLILGGLNEGSWPQLPAPDPWLAPRVRRLLGLPGLERRIGLSAHDLAGLLGTGDVLLTRAARDARSPTIASRFWRRLEALTGGLPPPDLAYGRLARAIDSVPGLPKRAPRPRVMVEAGDRPTRINVTDADLLAADPYAFYAKAILRIQPLDALDADPGPAWRGSLTHSVLERWAKDDDYMPGRLAPRMQAALTAASLHPLLRTLWRPQLNEAALWIEERIALLRSEARRPLESEVRGEAALAGITLVGRADRIDRLASGGLAIIDYKTGKAPAAKQVAAGYAMQLGLIGHIAEAGGFRNVAGRAEGFEYWSLSRDKSRAFGTVSSPVSAKNPVCAPEEFVALVTAQFARVAGRWLTGEGPYVAKLRPDYARSDYDHLSRLEEWDGRDV